MDISKILRDYGRLYLIGLRQHRLGTTSEIVTELGIPNVEYHKYIEYLDPKDTQCIQMFVLDDCTLVVRVDIATTAIDAIYIVRGTTIPNPALFLDPDERVGRVRLFTNGYGVYNAWQTTQEASDAYTGPTLWTRPKEPV